MLLLFPLLAVGAYADILNSAGTFAVLGASAVTNTGATTLGGDLGVYAGTSITGDGTITLSGSVYTPTVGASGVAQKAQFDANAAYTTLSGYVANGGSLTGDLTGQTLGGISCVTGGLCVYNVAAPVAGFSLDTGGVLALNFAGVDDANIVFKMASALITGSGSSGSLLESR
jgi:type VI secretion system secreted protein VgrG